MLKVGITGGIASGKSVVCQIFEVIGIPVYYADIRAKVLINEDENIRQAIIELLGVEAYRIDGSYNTTYVSSIVFSNSEKLKA
ncbi:MAG: dephospho-CoA kinase, partial [Saprospiraceae bacterium]